MARAWFRRNARTIIVSSVAFSVVVHTVMIGGWVLATLPATGDPDSGISNHVLYIPAFDRVAGGGSGSQERIRFSAAAVSVLGEGPIGRAVVARAAGNEAPNVAPLSIVTQAAGTDTTSATPVPAATGADSVFSVLEVDEAAVVRSASSAAPVYPTKLMQARIQGFVSAQYVVDTLGFAELDSFRVLETTHNEFAQAVLDALPHMRFTPARSGSTKVRQLVQQRFSFRLTDTLLRAPPKRP